MFKGNVCGSNCVEMGVEKLKNDVPRTFFDTNYVEMGVEAIEMD